MKKTFLMTAAIALMLAAGPVMAADTLSTSGSTQTKAKAVPLSGKAATRGSMGAGSSTSNAATPLGTATTTGANATATGSNTTTPLGTAATGTGANVTPSASNSATPLGTSLPPGLNSADAVNAANANAADANAAAAANAGSRPMNPNAGLGSNPASRVNPATTGTMNLEGFDAMVTSRWDTDGDGVVSNAEWNSSHSRWYGGTMNSSLRNFGAWDANHDGHLDAAELKLVFGTSGIHRIYDINGNGVIEVNEAARIPR